MRHLHAPTSAFFDGIARLSRLCGRGKGSEALIRVSGLSATTLASRQHLALTIAPSVHVWTNRTSRSPGRAVIVRPGFHFPAPTISGHAAATINSNHNPRDLARHLHLRLRRRRAEPIMATGVDERTVRGGAIALYGTTPCRRSCDTVLSRSAPCCGSPASGRNSTPSPPSAHTSCCHC